MPCRRIMGSSISCRLANQPSRTVICSDHGSRASASGTRREARGDAGRVLVTVARCRTSWAPVAAGASAARALVVARKTTARRFVMSVGGVVALVELQLLVADQPCTAAPFRHAQYMIPATAKMVHVIAPLASGGTASAFRSGLRPRWLDSERGPDVIHMPWRPVRSAPCDVRCS